MSDDLAYASATDLLTAFRAKSLSPVEATEAALARIDGHDELLNAFLLVDHEGALAAARESQARWARGEPRGLVDGVPTSVKDVLLTNHIFEPVRPKAISEWSNSILFGACLFLK